MNYVDKFQPYRKWKMMNNDQHTFSTFDIAVTSIFHKNVIDVEHIDVSKSFSRSTVIDVEGYYFREEDPLLINDNRHYLITSVSGIHVL